MPQRARNYFDEKFHQGAWPFHDPAQSECTLYSHENNFPRGYDATCEPIWMGRAGDCAALGSRNRSWVLGGRAERSIVNATVTASFLWNAGNLFLGFREVSSPELRDKDF